MMAKVDAVYEVGGTSYNLTGLTVPDAQYVVKQLKYQPYFDLLELGAPQKQLDIVRNECQTRNVEKIDFMANKDTVFPLYGWLGLRRNHPQIDWATFKNTFTVDQQVAMASLVIENTEIFGAMIEAASTDDAKKNEATT